MSERSKVPDFAWGVTIIATSLLSACLPENREDAQVVEVAETGGANLTSSATATALLDVPSAVLERTCPAASAFLQEGLRDDLLASCESCHGSALNGFQVSDSLAEEEFFLSLVAYVSDQHGGETASEHRLTTKASGVSHGGSEVWGQTHPSYSVLLGFVSAQITTPCDPEAALAAAAAGTGNEDAESGSESETPDGIIPEQDF